MEEFKPLIAKIANGAALSRADAERAFDLLLSGRVSAAQIGGFLLALRVRGETVDEVTGAVAAMRARMRKVAAPPEAIDIVGTGGDGHATYNISTLAALIVAACGVPVAKHGNRAATSNCGASDVLAALGVDIGALDAAASIAETGVGFMSAPLHHPAMRHVGEIRAELGTRTLFNLLGPLANPAGVKRQLLGVFSVEWLRPLAEVLRNLGAERVWLVHGSDGLDEITTTGPTHVSALEAGTIRSFEIVPEDAGIARAKLEDLRGGDAAHNAAALKAVLQGARNAYRDIALLNAGAALIVAEKAATLKEGAGLAAAALDTGRAADVLARLIRASQGAGK